MNENTHIELPSDCDLVALGLIREKILAVRIMHRRRVNVVYRITCSDSSYVLKWIVWPERSTERLAYRVLTQLRVPTLWHRIAGNAILLEDLAGGGEWELAQDADMDTGEVGAAVGHWYRALHDAGRRALAQNDERLTALSCQYRQVTAQSVRSLQARLGVAPASGWEWVADHVDEVVGSMHSRPQTLNYNDFHWSNLALCRSQPRRAVVFDYHLLGTGLACSDCRNVLGSLRETAKSGFTEAYGPVEEVEVILDAPIAELHALAIALEHPRLPGWAEGLLGHVRDGSFEACMRRAIEAART